MKKLRCSREWFTSRKGMDTTLLVQILLWSVIIIIVFFFIGKYIVGAGTSIPGEGLLNP